MKKKKLGLWLNITTISLALCAIVIGIYALRSASLSVNGSIGFVAKHCIVQVSGSYSAYESVLSENRGTKTLTTTTVGGKQSANKEIKDLSLFFSNLATDGHGDEIVFNLKITNQSDFKITVRAPAPTITTTSTASVICSSSDEKFILEKNASKSITLTYKLEDIETASDITDGKFSISLNFEKWQQYYVESVTEQFYDGAWQSTTTNKLCTTMGHSIVGTGAGQDGTTEVPIQWYAFAVRGIDAYYNNNYTTFPNLIFNNQSINGTAITEDNVTKITNTYKKTDIYTNVETEVTETWYSLYGVDMSNVDYKSYGYTFWFIQQYVTAGGYYMGTSDTMTGGVVFNSNGYKNYASSSIFTYLTDETTSSNYLSISGIKEDELYNSTGEYYGSEVYNSITTRIVNESYNVNFSADYVTDGVYTSTFSSKLWLISASELGLITNKSTSINTYGDSYGIRTPGISSRNLANTYNNYGAAWWLRSPETSTYGVVNAVKNTGSFQADNVSSNACGVRAAFQISIMA